MINRHSLILFIVVLCAIPISAKSNFIRINLAEESEQTILLEPGREYGISLAHMTMDNTAYSIILDGEKYSLSSFAPSQSQIGSSLSEKKECKWWYSAIQSLIKMRRDGATTEREIQSVCNTIRSLMNHSCNKHLSKDERRLINQYLTEADTLRNVFVSLSHGEQKDLFVLRDGNSPRIWTVHLVTQSSLGFTEGKDGHNHNIASDDVPDLFHIYPYIGICAIIPPDATYNVVSEGSSFRIRRSAQSTDIVALSPSIGVVISMLRFSSGIALGYNIGAGYTSGGLCILTGFDWSYNTQLSLSTGVAFRKSWSLKNVFQEGDTTDRAYSFYDLHEHDFRPSLYFGIGVSLGE